MAAKSLVVSFSAFMAAVAALLLPTSHAMGEPPATQPAVLVTPPARHLLDQVRDAYAALKSLAVSGTMDAVFDIDGVQKTNTARFTGLYNSSGQFKSEMRESSPSDPAATQPSSTDTIVGNTGEKLYAYLPERNRYVTIDAPKGKVDLQSLGDDVADIVRNQDLSLSLALATDAGAQLSEDATSILRLDDAEIDGTAYPTLMILYPRFDLTLLIDPATHLVRRSTTDLAKNARLQGAQQVKTATLTADYANTLSAPADARAFAWAPPPGAQPFPTAEDSDNSPLVGKPAPAFKLTGLDGKEVSAKSLMGSVYVLDFWATWCGPCVASLPHLDAIYKDYKDKGAKFFAVNVQEEKSTIQKFVDDTKLSIPVLMDSEGKTTGDYDTAGAIPFTVVVGKDGNVVKAGFIGGNEDQLRGILDAQLKK